MLRCVLVMLCACGRINFDPLGGGGGNGDVLQKTCALATLPVPPSGIVGGTLGGPDNAQGSCGGTGFGELIYDIDVPPNSGLVVATDSPTSLANTIVYVRSACADPASELVCDEAGGIRDFAAYRLDSVPAGRSYVFIDGEESGVVVGTIQYLLPDGAACNQQRDRCKPDLECSSQTSTCGTAGCAIVETFTMPGTYVRTAVTAPSDLNLFAGTCAEGHDGGVRAPETVYRASLAMNVSDLHVTTTSPMTDHDTLIYVRRGCVGGTELACNDDYQAMVDRTSDVRTGPLANGDYYIFIDGFATSVGTTEVTIDIVP